MPAIHLIGVDLEEPETEKTTKGPTDTVADVEGANTFGEFRSVGKGSGTASEHVERPRTAARNSPSVEERQVQDHHGTEGGFANAEEDADGEHARKVGRRCRDGGEGAPRSHHDGQGNPGSDYGADESHRDAEGGVAGREDRNEGGVLVAGKAEVGRLQTITT